MQMRCKLLNEFAIRSPSLPGPGNAFGFYEWARAGRGRRRAGPPPQLPVSAPATCRAARCCLTARRNLAARQRVSCSGRRGRLSARVPATLPAGVALGPEDTPPGAGLGLCPPAPLSPLWEWLLAVERAKLAFGMGEHWLPTCRTVCECDLGKVEAKVTGEGLVFILESLHLPGFLLKLIPFTPGHLHFCVQSCLGLLLAS